jgi:tRNA U34 5-carboxymethylaminomethyl modifying enzyme MnmG/GidA
MEYVRGLCKWIFNIFPEDIHLKLSSVAGFEKVKFFRPGYAIEYDYFLNTIETYFGNSF